MPGAAVCFDVEVARVLVERGFSVLLCGSEGQALGNAARSLGDTARIAVLIGDPEAHSDLAVAVTMAAELFGSDPVVVHSVGSAQNIVSPMGYRE